MTGLEIVALALATSWLALLSVIVMLLVRQNGLLTVRLDAFVDRTSPFYQGPEIGDILPDDVIEELPFLAEGISHVLYVSADCSPCKQLAAELSERPPRTNVAVLITGTAESSSALIDTLPPEMPTVLDPTAGRVAASLKLTSAPFALEVEDGKVTGKAVVHDSADLSRLIDVGMERRKGVAKLVEVGGIGR